MKISQLIAVVLLAGSTLQARTISIDGTAAVVAKVLITLQDAYFFSGLQHFKEGERVSLKREEGEELRNVVQKIALEEMVLAEMKSLQLDAAASQNEGTRGDAQRLIQMQKDKGREGEWRQLLQRYGRSEGVAVERLARSLAVERFLQRKVETLTPIITDAEVDRYMAQNPKRFRGGDLESLKPGIVLLLKRERMQKGLEEWVKVLKEKYGVTNLLNG